MTSEAEFNRGLYHGSLKLYMKDGTLYLEGETKDNKLVRGKRYFQAGMSFVGEFTGEDQASGIGSLFRNDHLMYTGVVKAGFANGEGKLFAEDGSCIYSGGVFSDIY